MYKYARIRRWLLNYNAEQQILKPSEKSALLKKRFYSHKIFQRFSDINNNFYINW